jgi:2-oxoglutarate ferredoxin oxidoreductase subunit gamma
MKTKIILAGFGGQGVIAGGRLLACAAMMEGKEVTHYPSYGAEMRGGTCNCSIVISDRLISSPIISEPDIAVILNTPSKNRFESKIVPNGKIILNSSLISENLKRNDVSSYLVKASEIAEESGSVKAANMAILGALSKVTSIVKLESLIGCLKEVFPNLNDKLMNININALNRGYENGK